MGDAQKTAVILAAGRGTRMRSSLAKVLHPLLGRPLGAWPVRTARAAGLDVVVVTHHQEEAVRAALAGDGVRFARQHSPRGTGDAVAAGLQAVQGDGVVVVLAGDVPLVPVSLIERLLRQHGDRAVTVVTARLSAPHGYGRLVRDGDGVRIVEQSELSAEQDAITEVNTGLYAFDAAWLRGVLPGLPVHQPKGEVYLTDTLALASEQGRAGVLLHDDFDDMMGVNDRWSLAQAARRLRERVLRRHALDGVSFDDPATTTVEDTVSLARDVVVGAGVILRGGTTVEEGVSIGPYCVIDDTYIASGAQVLSHSVCEGAHIGPDTRVGPFARLRPAARLERGARVGNFVEMKKSVLGEGSKASHLTYLGDATIGAGANIGAGTITCNYDGYLKNPTMIGDGAFIGSNSALVAPVRIGDGAIVGAGSVITHDVPDDAVAVARGRQVDKNGAASRFRRRREDEVAKKQRRS